VAVFVTVVVTPLVPVVVVTCAEAVKAASEPMRSRSVLIFLDVFII
jgi:hypothetical protein